jgi:hypothetical protein
MDKVIGWALGEGHVPLHAYALAVSGRLSFELVQKAAVAGCPILVGVGAPDLACRTTRRRARTDPRRLRARRQREHLRRRAIVSSTAYRSCAAVPLVGRGRLGSPGPARSSSHGRAGSRIAGLKATESVCPYCAVGCGQVVYTRGGELVDIEGNPNSPINQGTLCPKGQASRQLIQQPAA